MRVAVFGATGCIGRDLLEALRSSEDTVVAFYRETPGPQAPNLSWIKYDLSSEDDLSIHLSGVDLVYYLVHSLDRPEFVNVESRYAKKVNSACIKVGCKKVIYLGGIIQPNAVLSDHLRSRMLTGKYLSANGINVLELRASIVLAPCSTSFQIIKRLASRLPIMIVPKWLNNQCSPVYIDDLVAVLDKSRNDRILGHMKMDIGTDPITYRELLQKLRKKYKGSNAIIFTTPFLALGSSSFWIWLIARVNYHIAKNLTLSLIDDTSTSSQTISILLGKPPTTVDDALDRIILEERS